MADTEGENVQTFVISRREKLSEGPGVNWRPIRASISARKKNGSMWHVLETIMVNKVVSDGRRVTQGWTLYCVGHKGERTKVGRR